MLGFGFAFGGLMIIVEIIFAKLTGRKAQRSGSSLFTVLLVLTLSSSLTAVTIWMINTYYDPDLDKKGLLMQSSKNLSAKYDSIE